MAEALTRARFGDRIVVASTGVRPGPRVDPLAVAALAEIGIDASKQRPKAFSEVSATQFDLAVTVCGNAADECPRAPFAAQTTHAGFDDPPALAREAAMAGDAVPPIFFYRRVRDEVAVFVNTRLPLLLPGLGAPVLAGTARAAPAAAASALAGQEVLLFSGSSSGAGAMPEDRDSMTLMLADACAAPAAGAITAATVPELGGSTVEQPAAAPASLSAWAGLSLLDRLLPALIIGAMVAGIVLSRSTDVAAALDTAKIAGVSAPIAVGLWLMMWPVLCKVRYELLPELFRHAEMWRQVRLSILLNWVVGPALMTGLAWLTLGDLPHYRNGVVLVGLARCIAMVLVWNQLAGGSAEYCAVLVAINSVLQILLYAPLTVLFLGIGNSNGSDGVSISFWEVARNVFVFLGLPLLAGIATRKAVVAVKGRAWLDGTFLPKIGPLALVALVYTVVVLFGLQGARVMADLGNVARVAVPMCMYFAAMWAGALWLTRRSTSGSYALAVTQAFTASSNNFELAIAIAVATFGAQSSEALAATIGPLIEVPALLALVYVALHLRGKWAWSAAPAPAAAEAGAGAGARQR